jgi:hypothetical protein
MIKLPADYVVVRAGDVVQEISALGAANALEAQREPGQLYAKVGPDLRGEVELLIQGTRS